ncbi:MAG TPA: hypothetical protein RMH99_29240 [Sandaracinaceae bacterium LLY-WYZ-13_1]|nr:hypothetical protein [Sandaracinaceae bacterium LLY-WYZ-13_1]
MADPNNEVLDLPTPEPEWEVRDQRESLPGQQEYLIVDPRDESSELGRWVTDEHPAVQRSQEEQHTRQRHEEQRAFEEAEAAERAERTVVDGPRQNPNTPTGRPRLWRLDNGEWVPGIEGTTRTTSGYPAVDAAEQELVTKEYREHREQRRERINTAFASQRAGQRVASRSKDGGADAGGEIVDRLSEERTRSSLFGPGVEGGVTLDATPGDGLDEDDVGVNQRLRICVPNVFTQLMMGQSMASRDQDGSLNCYAGFGVETDGHIFMYARESKSSIKMQAERDVMLHAGTGGLAMAAKENSLLHSSSNSLVTGDAGVIIAGGTAMSLDPCLPATTSDRPEIPDWVERTQSVASALGTVWGTADALLGALDAAITLKEMERGTSTFPADVFALVTGSIGVGINGLGLANIDPFGGTVIHGSSGVSAVTPGTEFLFSVLGTSIASATGVGVVAPMVGVSAGVDLGLSACKGVASLSGNSAEVISNEDMTVASRHAETKISGKFVSIGNGSLGADDKPQQDVCQAIRLLSKTETRIRTTGGFDVQARNLIWMKAGQTEPLAGELEDDSDYAGYIVMEGKEGVGIHAPKASIFGEKSWLEGEKKAVVECGESALHLEPDCLTLGVGREFERYEETNLEGFKKYMNKALHEASGTQLVMKKSGAEIKVGSSSLKLSKSKVVSGPIEWRS